VTEWPKNPQLRVGGELEPSGPVNVFNEKVATAEAINRAIETKTAYDTTHPPPAPITPETVPDGTPISPGGPVTIDETKYMIEPQFVGHKVIPRRR
jgi:hypothetical protein